MINQNRGNADAQICIISFLPSRGPHLLVSLSSLPQLIFISLFTLQKCLFIPQHPIANISFFSSPCQQSIVKVVCGFCSFFFLIQCSLNSVSIPCSVMTTGRCEHEHKIYPGAGQKLLWVMYLLYNQQSDKNSTPL